MTTAAVLGANAIEILGVSPTTITSASINSWPLRPGLYAVYGSLEVWRTLTLGDPPDTRPLYVGKAERSLASRDVGTHFGFAIGGGNSITGSSTLRRSIAAMLRTALGLRGQYRNPTRPERPANFGLSHDQDAVLSHWMRENLLAAYWQMPSVPTRLSEVETVVLARLQPPLNIQGVEHQWKARVKKARAVMAADCSNEFEIS